MPVTKTNVRAIRELVKKALADGAWRQLALADQAEIDTGQLSRFLQRTDDRGLSAAKLAALQRILDGGPPSVDRSPLPAEHAHRLAQKLDDGQLVLFAGPGLSHLAPHRTSRTRRLPLWSELADRVAEAWGERSAAQVFPDPFDLFDHILYHGGRTRLEQVVRQALDDRPYGLSLAHVTLRGLPWSAVLTTGYDGLLQQSLTEKPLSNEEDYTGVRAADPPRLFQLHGTLADPHTLTRDDHRSWSRNHPQAMAHLRDLLQHQTVLFVGYSLVDRPVSDLFASIREWTHEHEKLSHAWMWRAPPAHLDLMRRRDQIDAVSFRSEDDYEIAFARVFEELKKIRRARVPRA
jgi:SIR2-like domain